MTFPSTTSTHANTVARSAVIDMPFTPGGSAATHEGFEMQALAREVAAERFRSISPTMRRDPEARGFPNVPASAGASQAAPTETPGYWLAHSDLEIAGPARPPDYDVACNTLEQIMKAATAQMVATGATFGLRPFYQAVIREMVIAAGMASSPYAPFIVAAASGPFVGFIHTAVGRSLAAAVNHVLKTDTHRLRSTKHALLHEIGMIDIPVMLSFVATYVIRGGVVGPRPDILTDAVSKSIASTLGGFVQGALTEGMKLMMPDAYVRVPPTSNGQSALTVLKTEFIKQWTAITSVNGPFCHDLAGKVVGSLAGDLASTSVTTTMASHTPAPDPMTLNAVGMQVYLMAWFGTIHALHAEQQYLQAPRPAPGEPAAGALAGSEVTGGRDGPGTASDSDPEDPAGPSDIYSQPIEVPTGHSSIGVTPGRPRLDSAPIVPLPSPATLDDSDD